MEQAKGYQVNFQHFKTNGQYRPDAIQVDWFNQGTTDVYISGRLLEPKTGFSMTGFPGEVDRTVYEIRFVDSLASGNLVIATMKRYI